jgi:RES domain-containing protein
MELRPDNHDRFKQSGQPDKKPMQQSLQEHSDAMAETKARARTAMRKAAQAKSHAAEEMVSLRRRAHGDTIDLSETARAFTQNVTEGDDARTELVQQLKTAYQSATLNTPERISQAAEKLLSDS